jgi:hypothetical protein
VLEEVGVGVVEVEAFVGDDQRVRLVDGALHLLLGVAPGVRAPIIAPATSKSNKFSFHGSLDMGSSYSFRITKMWVLH